MGPKDIVVRSDDGVFCRGSLKKTILLLRMRTKKQIGIVSNLERAFWLCLMMYSWFWGFGMIIMSNNNNCQRKRLFGNANEEERKEVS